MENLLNKYDNEVRHSVIQCSIRFLVFLQMKQLERLKKDLLELRLTYRRNKEQIPQWLHRRFQDVIRDIAMCAKNTRNTR